MLDDEDAINDVIHLSHTTLLPGGVRQTGDFADFRK